MSSSYQNDIITLRLTTITINFGATMNTQTKPQIPNKPTATEVRKYLAKWETLEDYKVQEKALNKLFETLPHNTELQDIMIKSATLNDFYSTNIFKVYFVAKHILNNVENIDNGILNGNSDIVDKIKTVNIDGKEWNFYSFATKYCSHHNPYDFPIYDSYVDDIIWFFQKEYKFYKFYRNELKNYKKFKEVLLEFQKYFNLEQFNLKELDRYLWLLGKETFPKK